MAPPRMCSTMKIKTQNTRMGKKVRVRVIQLSKKRRETILFVVPDFQIINFF